MRRLVLIVLTCLCLVSCAREGPPPPILIRYAGVNDDTEEIVNDRLRMLRKYIFSPDGTKSFEKKGRVYEFQRLPNPGYEGADDALTLALSPHTANSRPAAGLYFVDLYWFKTFCTEWLVPFEGAEWDAARFKEDFIKVCYLGEGPKRKLYAIPFSAKGNLLFYRRDILKLVGEQPPETWDELIAQVRRIRAMAASEPALANVKYGLIFHWRHLENDFYPIMWGYGGEIFSQDESERRLAVEALYMLKSMVHERGGGRIRLCPGVDELQGRFNEEAFKTYNCFSQGEAVFMINWDNRLDKMRKYSGATVAPQQVGVAPIPRASRESGMSASNIGSWGWVIGQRPEREDRWTAGADVVAAIREFVNDLTDEEAQEWLAASHGYIPSRNIALSEKARSKMAELGPGAVEAFELFADEQRIAFIDRPYNKRVNDIVERALKEAILAPWREGDEERKALNALLDDVRRRAQVFLSE